MPRIVLLDTYYGEMLSTWNLNPADGYEAELQRLLAFSFGTSDFYSWNLRALGWETLDIIANFDALQRLWAIEHNLTLNENPQRIVLDQIAAFKPDIVFLQDLSFLSTAATESLKGDGILIAGQCSCPMPYIEKIKQMDCIFTSFPHYVERFQELGVEAHYLPLAFEPDMLERLGADEQGRYIDCLFVGGVGWLWRESTELLETLAREIPTMQFWGYGYDKLPKNSLVRKINRGPAWGLDMYRLLRCAKIVVNRHGTVAGPWANNLRMFEATGCGALLLTEWKKNLDSFFNDDQCITYQSPQEAASLIRHYLLGTTYLDQWNLGRVIAEAGQQRTLKDHSYANRMPIVSETLKACL